METNPPQRYYFFLRQTRKNVKIFSQSVIFYVKIFNQCYSYSFFLYYIWSNINRLEKG